MSGEVVIIVCLISALSSVHCIENYFERKCQPNYYRLFVDSEFYCYIYFRSIDQNISTIDEDICRESSSRASPMTSVSFRNKEEFEFVKMLYRDFDQAGRASPLLFGLTYINSDFHWSDDTPFNYNGFLDVAYDARLSGLKIYEEAFPRIGARGKTAENEVHNYTELLWNL
ncbi:Lymphocyte antigen [Dirofilaria immitis]